MKKNYICLLSFCISSGITAGAEEKLPTLRANFDNSHTIQQKMSPSEASTQNQEAITGSLKQVGTSIDTTGKTITEAQATTNKTLQTMEAGTQIIGICTGTVYIVKSAKEGVEWIREWRNPDPEKAARKAAAIREMEALKATSALNKCLVYKRKEAKNSQGIPVACEEAYNEFVGALGFDKAEQTVQAFKRFNNPQ